MDSVFYLMLHGMVADETEKKKKIIDRVQKKQESRIRGLFG